MYAQILKVSLFCRFLLSFSYPRVRPVPLHPSVGTFPKKGRLYYFVKSFRKRNKVTKNSLNRKQMVVVITLRLAPCSDKLLFSHVACDVIVWGGFCRLFFSGRTTVVKRIEERKDKVTFLV